MSGEQVTFGRFRFDLGRRELSRDGIPVRLGNRALDVLYVLAAARGDVVTKDELLARVWPGQVVEENNLQVQVSALRKALDEEKSGQSYLVTVPSRGYRLIGVAGSSHGPALPDKPSIAVLPFQNMSDDPQQEYFADGIVEDIITALCHMRWLFVIARDSSFAYKGRTADVKRVGRELGVRYVVEGGVRKAAQRVRITAQLIDASTGRASVGRSLRRRSRGHLRSAGSGDGERGRRDRAEAGAGGDRTRQAQADREPRRLRLVPARDGKHAPHDAGSHQRGAGTVRESNRARS